MSNKALEEKINIFLENPNQDDYVKVMEELEHCKVFVPSHIPGVDLSQMQKNDLNGQKISLEGAKPLLLPTQNGNQVLPVFSSIEQVPKDKRGQLYMEVPYGYCVEIVLNNTDKISGILVNPFTKSFSVNKQAVEIAKKRYSMRAENKKNAAMQITEQDFPFYMHKKVLQETLAKQFFTQKDSVLQTLRKEKESYLLKLYKEVYQPHKDMQFEEEDFSVMFLGVAEDMTVIRVDLPDKKVVQGIPKRVYLVDCTNRDDRFFLIEKGAKGKPGNVMEVLADGTCTLVCEAPDNGVEIEKIMDIANA